MTNAAKKSELVKTGKESEASVDRLAALYRETRDQRYYEALHDACEKELLQYLERVRRIDRETAADAAQVAFRKFASKPELYDPARSFMSWFRTVAFNAVKDLLRAQPKIPAVSLDASHDDSSESFGAQIPCEADAPDVAAERAEAALYVRQAVRKLPEDLGCVVELCWFEGKSKSEAAEILRVACATVSRRLESAMKKLRFLVSSAALF